MSASGCVLSAHLSAEVALQGSEKTMSAHGGSLLTHLGAESGLAVVWKGDECTRGCFVGTPKCGKWPCSGLEGDERTRGCYADTPRCGKWACSGLEGR